MTRTAEMADVVLPGASFLEKSGTFTNGERRVQRVNQAVEPLEGTKPDGQIVVELMNRMGYEQPDYEPATLLDEISGIVPFFTGIKWDELGINGKQWPVAANGQDTPILHKETFTRGKGLFAFNAFKETEEVVSNSEKFPFILTTNRNLEHYNCGAQTRRAPASPSPPALAPLNAQSALKCRLWSEPPPSLWRPMQESAFLVA